MPVKRLGMDEGKAAALMQVQVRRNAEDLQSYMKGLESWEEDIKKKDESLSRQKPILKEVYIIRWTINRHNIKISCVKLLLKLCV